MLNRVQLIGNLGREPEVVTGSSGKKVAKLSVACSKRWTDKQTGDKRESTEWVRVVIFNERLIDVVEKYTDKGSKLFVEGEFRTRKWTDDKGVERYVTEVVLGGYDGQIILLDKKRSDSDDSNYAGASDGTAPQQIDDEIPF